MKKILIVLFLLFFIPSISSAATTYFAIDDTVDLSVVTGFQFDIIEQDFDLTNEANLQIWFQGDVLSVGGEAYPGAVSPIPGIWDIFSVNSPKKGIAGNDATFGSFPLISGIVFQIDSPIPLHLDPFSWFLMEGFGDIVPDVQLLSKTLSDGSLMYIASQVPIPSSLLLLGGGICALLGITRRKKG